MCSMLKPSSIGSFSRRQFLALAGLGACALVGCGSPAPASSGAAGSSSSAGASSASNVAAGSSAAASASYQEATLFVFDTVVSLRCACSSQLMDQLSERCNYFENHFSRTIEGSDVWNINHAGGSPVHVAPETADVIQKALDYGERSGGLFDITIGAVTTLWDFANAVKPDDEAIRRAVGHVDYHKVHVQGDVVQLDDPQAMIDLGGIAKGYIADDLVRMLHEGGCESGIVNLGGNAYVVGSKSDGSAWTVGVQDPNGATGQKVIAKITCTDASVVTSGLYEREFVKDGVRYYHILDPKTGYPVETDLVSSSVYSSSSLEGDVYATWMFLLGREAALSLLESTPGLEGLVIDADNNIVMTSNAHFELL